MANSIAFSRFGLPVRDLLSGRSSSSETIGKLSFGAGIVAAGLLGVSGVLVISGFAGAATGASGLGLSLGSM